MRSNQWMIEVCPLIIRALTAHTHPRGHSLKCWPNMLLKIHAEELALRVAVQFCLRHVGQRPGANIRRKLAIENAAASTLGPCGRRCCSSGSSVAVVDVGSRRGVSRVSIHHFVGADSCKAEGGRSERGSSVAFRSHSSAVTV